jgi:hypothetical protein
MYAQQKAMEALDVQTAVDRLVEARWRDAIHDE